jgi:peptide-methionine (S)-S-oxide reductase
MNTTSILILLSILVMSSSFSGLGGALRKKMCHRVGGLNMALRDATFGMGCFWAPQKLFDEKEGVTQTFVGYTGGTNSNPTYSTVCRGDGHIEAVRVQYDDDIINYDELLDIFYAQEKNDLRAQTGQYQSAIFLHDEEQKRAVEQRGDNNGLTKVLDPSPFYVAEEYHQRYEKKLGPRLAILLAGFIIDIIPGLPDVAYRTGGALTVAYILLFLYERVLVPSTMGKLQTI